MIEFFYNLNIKSIVLISILAFAGIVQIFYYIIFYIRIIFKDKTKKEDFTEALSVVICARNEGENLKKYIPLIAEQSYNNFEIVIVNDCSADDTEFILDFLEKKYKNLRHTTIKEDSKFSHGKKLALTIGIKSAKNEHLILTDADCYPASENWLKEISQNFSETKKIIISYGAFEKGKGFLNKFIRYDNFFNSIQFLSFAKAGIPYMGTGRNMAYTKSLFIENKGFASHYNIMSGDDDLFVNENASIKNTAPICNAESFTYSPAKKSFTKFYQQKIRHLSTAKKYKFIHKLLLSLEPFSRITYYSFSILILSLLFNYLILAFVIFVFIIKFTVLKLASNKMKEKDLFIFSLIFDMFLPIFYLFLHTNNVLVKRRKWS